MPTKAQIESTTLALRKSVARYNKAQLKLNKADQAYQKGRKKKKGDALRKLVNRWNKAKMEFLSAQANYVKVQKHFKEVMGRG